MNDNGSEHKENCSNKKNAKPVAASESAALPTTSGGAEDLQILLPELTVTYVGIKCVGNNKDDEVAPVTEQPRAACSSSIPLRHNTSERVYDSEEELNNIEPAAGTSSFHAVVAYTDVNSVKVNSVAAHQSPKSSIIPPSYSTVIKFPPPAYRQPCTIGSSHSNIFTSRVPPPSYAEVQGFVAETSASELSEEHNFGPEPQYIGCPQCSAIVITEIHLTNSKLTHFTALGLCLLGCWPCCLLPYFMESCKDTRHYCPNCHYFFGIYRPLF